MLFWVKVIANRFKSKKKSLGLPWRFESPHSSLSATSGLKDVCAEADWHTAARISKHHSRNRLLRYFDPAIQHHFFDIPVAQRQGVVEPDTVADDFAWESVTSVHKLEIALSMELVRLFYFWVKLTILLTEGTLEIKIASFVDSSVQAIARLFLKHAWNKSNNLYLSLYI